MKDDSDSDKGAALEDLRKEVGEIAARLRIRRTELVDATAYLGSAIGFLFDRAGYFQNAEIMQIRKREAVNGDWWRVEIEGPDLDELPEALVAVISTPSVTVDGEGFQPFVTPTSAEGEAWTGHVTNFQAEGRTRVVFEIPGARADAFEAWAKARGFVTQEGARLKRLLRNAQGAAKKLQEEYDRVSAFEFPGKKPVRKRKTTT